MSMCEGKVGFDTEADARAELARIITRAMLGDRHGQSNRKGETRHNRLESGTYECLKPGCGKWHLSSEPWGGRIVNDAATQRKALR